MSERSTPETDNAMKQMACFSDHPAVECLSALSGKLERQRDELAEALRPFAALSQEHQSMLHPTTPVFGINGANILKRDVDKARTLLDRIKP